MFPRLTSISSALVFALSAAAVNAHEFWIDPVRFSYEPGERIIAATRVGQEFAGMSGAFLPQQFRRFDIVMNGKVTPVEGRLGDRPALSQTVSGTGLAIIVHETTNYVITYETLESFQNFLEHKDAMFILGMHTEKSYPIENFKERYSRYAKSLVAVGGGAGRDTRVGLATEIVALTNPYTDDVSGGVAVQLYYDGKTRPDSQVEVFEKAPDGAVKIFTVRTNADGIASIPVKAGHRYMLDHVVLRPASGADPDQNTALWESLWANLTFGVPAGN